MTTNQNRKLQGIRIQSGNRASTIEITVELK
jgi:hypothetical protein